MTDFIITKEPAERLPGLARVQAVLKRQIVEHRFESPLGIGLLSILSLLAAVIVAKGGLTGGAGIIALAFAIPVGIMCVFHLKTAIIATITLSFFLLGLKRVTGDLQVGVLMDVMIALMFAGLVIRQISEHNWRVQNNAVNKAILVWIAYNILELVNPSAESRLAWLYTVRSFAGIMIMYYLLMYAVDNRRYFFLLLKLWIGLTVVAMVWGYYQEFVGLLRFEEEWIRSVPERYALLFQAGKFRKFSIFSDPLVYGFMMAITSILCFILALGPVKKSRKVVLILLSVLMMYGMLFSGTRAAFLLPMAAFLFYALISFSKRILLFGSVSAVVLMILITVPTSNPDLYRFQSAFRPQQDASYQVRVKNQAFIQPYIQTHPLGGGLGSVGEWGKQFSPWSPLANFPPDSGFVRIAVEEGWLGLLLYCTLLFTIFKKGISDYFRMRDPLLKNVSLAMLVVLFALVLANYPQEAIGQYPINLLFFVAIALLFKSRELDSQKE